MQSFSYCLVYFLAFLMVVKGCSSDADCNHYGICSNGTCSCFEKVTGINCTNNLCSTLKDFEGLCEKNSSTFCEVLAISQFPAYGGSCFRYCSAFHHKCLGAWEDFNNGCHGYKESLDCTEKLDTNLICRCGTLIDACSSGRADCSPNANCIHDLDANNASSTSFVCTCKPGFQDTGIGRTGITCTSLTPTTYVPSNESSKSTSAPTESTTPPPSPSPTPSPIVNIVRQNNIYIAIAIAFGIAVIAH